ncbi:MAG: hypothetical protein NT139_02945 [Candidatus Woesearchaeota archaeon]|nr:hypothetical protein [Candidatus Woesearchaeota archaeon]
MNKKGAELPLTTMIVAIIVIVVLVVIIAFFLSGTYSLKQSISRIFYGTTGGTDQGLAVQICQQNCDVAKSLTNPDLQKQSQFCKQYFNLDTNNDGEADFNPDTSGKKVYIRWYCTPEAATSAASKESISGTQPERRSLAIPCEISC